MEMQLKGKVKFINKDRSTFFSTLRKRVDAYFEENNISKKGNASMVFKTIVMSVLYFGTFLLILTNDFTSWQMLILAVVMGIGQSGIGLSVMHDANHGSYSSNNMINMLLGNSVNLIGGYSHNWKIQHNILHHTYTNIHDMDEDLDAGNTLRFTPEMKHRSYHKFQHIYFLLIYSLLTLNWALVKDFKQLFRYYKNGLAVGGRKKYIQELIRLIFTKVLYFSFIFVLPLYVLNITWWQWIIGFLAIHLTAGVILSVIFQLAHIVEDANMPELNDTGDIDNEWAIHQLVTTANFASKDRLLSWYVGGLNFQVEHHLFPKICHVHYKNLSSIVRKTAVEYGLPYNDNPTFRGAFRSHIRFLKRLGRPEFAVAS